jgi:glutamyl-tRNA reductase
MLLTVGCSFRTTPVALRERLAFDADKLARTLDDLTVRYGCEAVILGTCNRVELYLARPEDTLLLDIDLLAEFLGEIHGVPPPEIRPHLYEHRDWDAVRHLFRVVASLDSLILGEGQIAGQVKKAYEVAQGRDAAGPLLNALFQHARQVGRRVRTETGITRGRVSVSSAAVDYVRQVFEHFDDKRILVIGAGKMGELTLRHLRQLRPQKIWVTNRSPEKARALAAGCGGEAVPWENLDDTLVRADIVLSTTGAAQPIVTLEGFEAMMARRKRGTMVILDIAVPRDFDPRIQHGDLFLFNIDDLKSARDATLAERRREAGPAEAIVNQEVQKFRKEWGRRRCGPVIQRLIQDAEAKRQEIVRELFDRLNGRLSADDRADIDKAFQRFQSKVLHGPISALTEEPHDAPAHGGHTLLDALRKLFRLHD